MRLFEMKDWELKVSEEAWGLIPFQKLLKRDKSKDKTKANKEMLFIFFWADLKSVYAEMDEESRMIEIKKDIGLPDNWKPDPILQQAIDFYIERSETVIVRLYKSAVNAANAVSRYINNTEELLQERDKSGKPIYDTTKISRTLKDIPTIMDDLEKARKKVIQQKEDESNRKKGSQTFNTFEDGF